MRLAWTKRGAMKIGAQVRKSELRFGLSRFNSNFRLFIRILEQIFQIPKLCSDFRTNARFFELVLQISNSCSSKPNLIRFFVKLFGEWIVGSGLVLNSSNFATNAVVSQRKLPSSGQVLTLQPTLQLATKEFESFICKRKAPLFQVLWPETL